MGFLALTNGLVHVGTPDTEPVPGTLLLREQVVHGVYPSLPDARAAVDGAAVEAVDVSGMTVLPGLMDCHVHLFFDGGLDMVTSMTTDIGGAAERAATHLRAGVTTIRELGAPTPAVFALRDGIADGTYPGPRVLAAGPIVTTPQGHGNFIGEIVAPDTDMADAVRRLADQGVNCIKVAVSGGVSTPGSDLFTVQFTEPQLRAGVATAHALGLRIAAHASTPRAIRIAAAAGVDSVEHGVVVDDAALAALARSTTMLVPTLAATNKSPEVLDSPEVPDYIREKGKVTVPTHRKSISRAVAAGIRMAGGTDAGSTMTAHGLVAMEAEQLAACGLSTADAIAAVTRNAAELLGIDDRAGTLEPGKTADVAVVAGNPFQDIAALGSIRLVIKEGTVVHRVEEAST